MASDLYGVALDAPVVLEVGSAFIRVGLAGEATPRHIVPSPLADWFPAAKSPAQVDDYCDEATATSTTHPEETVDEDSSGNNAKKSLLFRQYTCSQWIAQLTPLLSDIIYGKLLIKPKSRRILILEPMVAPTNFRNAIAHILFVKFGFPSLLFVPGSSSVSCFSIGANHGLVVDVGHAEARCAIIFGGRYVPQTFHAVPCGYENVVKLFQSYTVVPELKNNLSDAFALLQHATNAMGGISLINQQLVEGRENVSEVNLLQNPLGGRKTVRCTLTSSGKPVLVDTDAIQAAWSEVLDVTYDTSIPYMILCSLLQCPIDLRKIIAKNIVLVGGGGCLIQGFQDRILFELHCGVQSVPKFKKLRALDVRFHKIPFSRDLIPWIGLSIMGTLRLTDEKWVFLQSWVERMKPLSDCYDELNGDNSNRDTSNLMYDWLHA